MVAAARPIPLPDDDDRYRAIVENANDLIVTGDLEERIVYVNAAFERALGYPRDELIGRPLAALVDPKWCSQLEDAGTAKLSGRVQQTVYDLEFTARDGHVVVVEVSSWLVCEEGDPVGFQAICRDVTERNAAEQALRLAQEALYEREDILERAFDSTAVGILLATLEGCILKANQAFAALLGYTPDELVGKSVVDVTHPNDRADTVSSLGRLLTGGVPRVLTERRFVRKDGEPVWVQVGVSPVRNAAGEPTAFVSQVVDISARRKAADALRESEELFRAAFEGAAIGMLMVSPYGNIVRANRAFCELLGYELGELRRLDVIELTHPDDRPTTAASLARLRDGELARFVADKRYLRKDGELVWTHVAVSPVRSLDGVVRGYVTQVIDLTARHESEERFRLLFESSPHGMDVVDADGRMLQANAALQRMLGYDRDELLALRFEDFTHPDDRHLDDDLFAEMLDGKRPHYELDKRCVHKDGRVVWVRLTAFALPTPGRRPTLAIGILEDITERRVLAEQLRHSQRMEAVGQLAGGIAHDFNNLLTAVASYCDLASDALGDDADERLSASVTGIRGAADRAADLTRQLLAFSRRQVLELAPLDLNVVVEEHAPMLRRLLGDDVDVRLSLDADAATVTVDVGQLVQVLMNLAANARDAMPEGGTLTIDTENIALDCAPTTSGEVSGEYVLLAVSDTGTGMDAETQSRIFEPFFTTKEEGKGTGLGLATVLGIVEQSGGRLTVYSEPGIGTTFKIYLPAVVGPEKAGAQPERPVRPHGRERILLVEDNDAVRGPVTAVLDDLGYEVIPACGPVEAGALADGEAIDLLVTDVVMPVMNGRQLAEQLLRDHPEMKVLFISGYTDDAVIARGVVEPGTAFLQKPFGADRLAQKIRELLDD